jgi:hypothetical protein
MKNMKEYKIVESSKSVQLERLVDELLVDN